MVPTGFVVAMHGCFTRRPCLAVPQSRSSYGEWIIVSRFGANGEYITISLTATIAGASLDPDALPPLGIAPVITFFGCIIHRVPNEPIRFLLAQHLPSGMLVAGKFRPCKGTADLSPTAAGISLQACGTLTCVTGGPNGVIHEPRNTEFGESPDTAEQWQIRARRWPWLGEMCPA